MRFKYLAICLMISVSSFAASYECFEGQTADTSKYSFKLDERGQSFTFTFVNKSSNTKISNEKSFNPSAASISRTKEGFKSYQYYPANLDLQISIQPIAANVHTGKFNFYVPKVNGQRYTDLHCIQK